MAVNLSPRQFRHGRLAARIEAALADTGFDASLLELEITESALMADPEAAARMLAHLKSMGIRVSIDDFGTGYSSLGYLKRLPVDGLKIDRSFVSDCCDQRRDAAIVSAVIGLARELALEVVAEGVENAGQLAYLHRQRCELGQGYYFSRPLPADGIRALLAGGSLPAATLEPVA
jgi:EAL domain-containing protein (putative c-di-GMP-specific phosphodiesterase class I)